MKLLTRRRQRCEGCGHPIRRRRDARDAIGNPDGRVYHGPCHAYLHWRRVATERLHVLGIVTDLAGLTGLDITTVVELRAGDDIAKRVADSNEVFRVYRDLELAEADRG